MLAGGHIGRRSGAGSTEGGGQLGGRGAWASTGSKIATPICTRKSEHKTPKPGHSKQKAAANHLFGIFFFLN